MLQYTYTPWDFIYVPCIYYIFSAYVNLVLISVSFFVEEIKKKPMFWFVMFFDKLF